MNKGGMRTPEAALLEIDFFFTLAASFIGDTRVDLVDVRTG